MRPLGSLVFSLEGAFVGAVVEVSSGTALVPADTMLGVAATIDRTRVLWSIGIRLQRLDEGLAAALGVEKGAVVAGVEPGSVSRDRLAPGDVVTAVDGAAVAAPEDVLFRVAAADPAKGIDLDLVRGGEHVKVHVADGAEPAQSGAAPAAETRPPSTPSLGAQLVPSARGSRVRAVDPGSPAERAGLAAGDEIWWVQGTTSAGPPAITRAWRALAPGRRLALGVDAEHPRLLALEKP